MARSRVIGDFALRRRLKEFPDKVDLYLKPVMQLAAQKILSDMQRLIPEDSGKGRAALTAFVSKNGLDAKVGLNGKRAFNKAFYLYFIEYGTKGYSGEIYRRQDASAVGGTHTHNRSAKKDRPVKNKTDGAHWFGKYPDIPARPAHPFIRPALDLNRDYFAVLIRNAIVAVLKSP